MVHWAFKIISSAIRITRSLVVSSIKNYFYGLVVQWENIRLAREGSWVRVPSRPFYYRPLVEWFNTAVSKTVDPGFESQPGEVKDRYSNYFSLDDKLVCKTNESWFESSVKTICLVLGI